jgi:hypothetical protein
VKDFDRKLNKVLAYSLKNKDKKAKKIYREFIKDDNNKENNFNELNEDIDNIDLEIKNIIK